MVYGQRHVFSVRKGSQFVVASLAKREIILQHELMEQDCLSCLLLAKKAGCILCVRKTEIISFLFSAWFLEST